MPCTELQLHRARSFARTATPSAGRTFDNLPGGGPLGRRQAHGALQKGRQHSVRGPTSAAQCPRPCGPAWLSIAQSWSGMVPRDGVLYNRLSSRGMLPRALASRAVFIPIGASTRSSTTCRCKWGRAGAGLMKEHPVYEAFPCVRVSRAPPRRSLPGLTRQKEIVVKRAAGLPATSCPPCSEVANFACGLLSSC
jgi:hypothetical protein